MRIGIDLGGTKIEIVALDGDGGERLRRRVPTPQGDYAATVEVVAALVEAAERELGAAASVGIGTPGSPSPRDGRIRNANSTCLNGRSLQADLSSRLGRTVRIANDANCFAVSEAADGAGAGSRVVFGVILGTGVGGGVVVGGQLLAGANAIAGEWGHVPLPPADDDDADLPACYCGRRGCIETYLSGPGLSADHARVAGKVMAPPAIAAAAGQGDAECEATLARYETRLGRALAMVINILDPDVIVLGGGLSQLDRLYRNVPLRWRRHVFSDSIDTRLVPSEHGDSSGVRGAAWLWPTA